MVLIVRIVIQGYMPLTGSETSCIFPRTCMVNIPLRRRCRRNELPSIEDGGDLRPQPNNPHADGREGCEQEKCILPHLVLAKADLFPGFAPFNDLGNEFDGLL
jgi:hypothetical protein